MKIYKHTVPIDGSTHSVLLAGPVLHVDNQRTTPPAITFWSQWQPDETGETGYPKQPRVFRAYATGEEIPNDATYHGTTLLFDGEYVYHLIELTS